MNFILANLFVIVMLLVLIYRALRIIARNQVGTYKLLRKLGEDWNRAERGRS